jgi:hypothetical protein
MSNRRMFCFWLKFVLLRSPGNGTFKVRHRQISRVARAIYIQCMGNYGQETTKYTVMYGV